MNAARQRRWLEELPDPAAETWKYTNLPAAVRAMGPLETGPALIRVPDECVDGAVGKRGEGTLSVRLGANAQAMVIERHSGEGKFWNNLTLDISLGQGA